MSTNRDIYKYYLKRGNKIVHAGITNDIQRREHEHRLHHGEKTHIKQVGRRTTREAAFKWEAEQRQKWKPVGS